MARLITMPVLGMYTEEGILTAWLRRPGELVEAGDAVAELTTEKTAFEVPAPVSGVLHPVAEVGATIRVEGLIGYVLAEGEDVSSVAPPEATSAGPEKRPLPQQHRPSPENGAPIASPAARRAASQRGIDLAAVTGTGPGGRIVEADIRAAVAQQPGERRILRTVPLAGSRRETADRLRSTLSTAASTTLMREVDMGALMAERRRLAGVMGTAPSYSALFVRLLAGALRDCPDWNAAVENDSIVVFDAIHVGFAVATTRGLVVPVVRNADSLPFPEVAQAVRTLTERALAGRFQPGDLEGGTASVTNLGSHGIDGFTPILNGHQAVILGIGRIAERPTVANGTLTVGHTCVLSLTFDHRIADGVPAARLLEAIVRRMNSAVDGSWKSS